MKTDDKSSIIEQHLNAIEKKDKSSRNFKLLAVATVALGCAGGWVLSKSMSVKPNRAASKIVQVKNVGTVQEQPTTIVKDVVKVVRKPKIVLKPSENGEITTDSVATKVEIVEEGSEWFSFPNTTDVVFDEQEIVKERVDDTVAFKQYAALEEQEWFPEGTIDTAKQWVSENVMDTAKHIALQEQ